MVLIFSEIHDSSTNNVIDWLDFNNIEFIRINENTKVSVLWFDLKKKQIILKIKNKTIKSSEISGFWYRRGRIPFFKANTGVNKLDRLLNNLYSQDQDSIFKFLYYFLQNKTKNKIGSFHNSEINKLYQLCKAYDVELNIPETYIATNLSQLPSNKRHITKSFSSVFEKYDTAIIQNYTNEIKKNKKGPFFASLVQEKIDKKYELRVFYLKGRCYSMAIFSQENKKTNIDYRHYDKEKPNRWVPCKLPGKIQAKIKMLMDDLKLDTGSIDLIFTNSEKYIFLEVNPVGQFGMVSNPCNYQLEKLIAKTLSK